LRADLGDTLLHWDFQFRRRLRRVIEVGKGDARQRLSDRALDRAQVIQFFRRCEGKRFTRHLGARGASDAVDVILTLAGDIEVDDVA
jgi:hypothetical protein